MNFRFFSPDYLVGIVFVPVLLLIVLFFYSRARKKLNSSFGNKLYPFLTQSVSPSKRKIRLYLQGFVLVAALVAMARPQMGEGRTQIKARGVELVIALDVSNSMLAEDVKPSRLEHAKKEVNRLLDQLSGDKVGLVAFAGSAAVISPLTSDYSAIRMFVESLSPDSVSNQGTSFKAVIKEASDAFKRGGLSAEEEIKVTRVLLIFTDGEDQEADAMKLANEEGKKGLRIFTVGFGTQAGAPIPVRDQRGQLIGYKKGSDGQIILSKTNSNALASLAKAGGGAYYHATFGGDEIAAVRKDIDKLEKADFESEGATTYNEYFQYVLALAALLALIESLLTERRKEGRLWKGRFEVKVS